MTPRARFTRTAFFTSLLSLAIFALAEWMRPGFVSRSFSFNWLIVAMVVFGLWWMNEDPKPSSNRFFPWIFALLFALLAVMLVWNLGAGFGSMRLLLSLIAALVPFVLVRLLNE